MPWPIYDKHDDIPEAFQGEYEEREVDGVKKWHPKLPDVSAAQTALEKERQRAADEEKARKKAERDLVELRRQQAAKEGGITEEQLQKLREEDANARKPIEEELERVKAENRKLKLTDRVKAAALAAGVMADRIDDAMLLLATRTDLTTDGDSIVVKDAKGNILAGRALTDFLTKDFKQEKPWLYSGSGASGTGGAGGGTGGDPAGDRQDLPRDRAEQHRSMVTAAL